MELEYVKVLSAVILLVVTFLATMLPMFLFKKTQTQDDEYRREDNLRVISFLSCFGAGVFLGTCLLHLFPDVQEQMDQIFKGLNIVPNYPVSEFLFGFGFLTVLIVEQILLNCQEHSDSERVPILPQEPTVNEIVTANRRLSQENTALNINYASPNYGTINPNPESYEYDITYVQGRASNSILRSLLLLFALSLHSIFEGLAIGLQTSTQSDIRILIAVLIHKCIIAFTLGLNLTHSELRSGNVIKSNVFFSLASPIGILIGLVVVDFVKGLAMIITSGILQGLAAGTFLYITLFEVLPKELNCGKDRMVKMACVVLGYSVVSLLLTFLPE